MKTTIHTDERTRALCVIVHWSAGDEIGRSWEHDGPERKIRHYTRRASAPIRCEVEIPIRQLEYLAERALTRAARRRRAG